MKCQSYGAMSRSDQLRVSSAVVFSARPVNAQVESALP